MKHAWLVAVAIAVCCLFLINGARAATAFSYKGSLAIGGLPVTGTYDFQFSLYTAPSGGTKVGSTLSKTNVAVSSGVYTVSLDFGSSTFTTPPLYLHIAYRKTGTTVYTNQSGRAQTSVAFAAIAGTANALQGRSVATTTPATGQVLKWNGTAWAPAPALEVPLAVSASSSSMVFRVNNTGAGQAILGDGYSGVGVWGRSLSDIGVYGQGDSNVGVQGTSLYGTGVYGASQGDGWGVLASSVDRAAVYGSSTHGAGIQGFSQSAGTQNAAVVGGADPNKAWAGYFHGLMGATDKRFVIDHPLDPANATLTHSCVESDERKNVYDGVVTLNRGGRAWVQLPDYFEALNTEFRYQLTAIGAPGPNLHIAQKVTERRFLIAGGSPGMEVSWQITGVRQDAYARAHPMTVEDMKPQGERGRYLNPVEHGQPLSQGLASFPSGPAAGQDPLHPRAR